MLVFGAEGYNVEVTVSSFLCFLLKNSNLQVYCLEVHCPVLVILLSSIGHEWQNYMIAYPSNMFV
jgi:hypothetical protein